MEDKTEFRIGRSHGDIVYHHVKNRHYTKDPRYAVCQSVEEAQLIVDALNDYCEGDTTTGKKETFRQLGLRW